MSRKLVLFLIFVILLVIASIAIKVGMTNESPKVNSSVVMTQEDTPVSIKLKSNDPDSDFLIYKVMAGPSHGSLSGKEPNLIYTPNLNFHGVDNFSFKASDRKSDSPAAIISITVTSVNDSIQANDDNATVREDAPVITINVLDNDIDPDNDRLVVLNVTQAENGSVTINTDSTLAYAPNKNFSVKDSFTYTVSDGKGATNTATVNVTVDPVNDAPRITSKPQTTTRVWASYTYDVDAKDADQTDTLTYSLITKPEGMKINSSTGLIEWIPTSAQSGDYDITLEVADSNSIPVTDTQSYTLTVASLSKPLTTVLTVEDGYNQSSRKKISEEGQISAVKASDNNWLETELNSYTSYDFCKSSIPDGARIISVVVFIEHFEQEKFPSDKLKWHVGSGWPESPNIWASTTAPIHLSERYEAIDTWDITTYADTSDKSDVLQLKVENTNRIVRAKTLVDHVYVVVKWY